jgi:predicted PurR-regulated permease PerM
MRTMKIPDDIKLPLFLVAILILFLSVYLLREMLIPFTVAILLTYLLRPAVVVISQFLDYMFSCCGARCCRSLQERSRANWDRLWGWVQRRLCCCCCERKKRAAHSKKHDGDAPAAGPDDALQRDIKQLQKAKQGQYKCWEAESEGETDEEAGSSESRPLKPLDGGVTTAGAKAAAPGAAGGVPDSGDAGARKGVDPTEFYSVSCSRLTAVLLATALAVGVIAILVLIVVDSIHSFHDKYWATFSQRLDAVLHNIVTWIQENLHFDASSLLTSADALVKEISSGSTLMSIAAAIIVVVVTLLFMMFLLLDDRFDTGVAAAKRAKERAAAAAAAADAKAGGSNRSAAEAAAAAAAAAAIASEDDRMWSDIDAAIHRYLIAKTLVSVAMGLGVFLVLGPILHVKLAHLFGVLTVILNFIPNVGALIAALVPLPIILLDPDLSVAAQVLAILLPLAIHFVVGNFVEPFVLGPLLSLHPVVVLLSLSFWYVLWGVAGAILAVPITSVIAIGLKRSRHAYADFIVTLLEEFRVDLSLLRLGGGCSSDGKDGGAGGASGGGKNGSNGGSGGRRRGGGGGLARGASYTFLEGGHGGNVPAGGRDDPMDDGSRGSQPSSGSDSEFSDGGAGGAVAVAVQSDTAASTAAAAATELRARSGRSAAAADDSAFDAFQSAGGAAPAAGAPFTVAQSGLVQTPNPLAAAAGAEGPAAPERRETKQD